MWKLSFQNVSNLNSMSDKEHLIDAAIAQIKKDLEMGDTTAIAELLQAVPEENLKAFLPEEGE